MSGQINQILNYRSQPPAPDPVSILDWIPLVVQALLPHNPKKIKGTHRQKHDSLIGDKVTERQELKPHIEFDLTVVPLTGRSHEHGKA